MAQVGISNTEVQNAYSCELAWGFGFHPDLNYQKRSFGGARERGIIGHAALETWYKGLRDGEAPDSAAQRALSEIQAERTKELKAGEFADFDRVDMLNWLYTVLTKYFEYYEGDAKHWEILEVEAFHAQEFDNEEDFYLPSRLDVTIYQKAGQFKGETSPLDHKFTYDFWQPYKLDLNSQFPLYILALRAARFAGKPKPIVKRVIVNQIRTRLKNPENAPPHELFKRSFKAYEKGFMDEVFNNHMKSAVRLAYLKRIPWEEAVSEIRAALGSMACQYCDFKDVCKATFEGRDTSEIIAATLKKNEYGYPPLEEIRRERAS
ncbi:PD-(D/E)XK nuclease family protein [Streptomyces sp. NPDC048720]|uniref:PD-(D/E)XK nuclease family protein n=1 Tax=Streptomyces sp. NPDC048720 TaxID=3365588 RepID=UPI003713ED60